MGVAIGGIGDESFLRLTHNTGDERVKIIFFDVIQLRSNIKQKLSHFCVHDVNLYILLHHITLILIIMKG